MIAGGAVSAAPVEVQVRDAGGRPVADAVVTLQMPHGAGPIHFPWPYVMGQRNIAFDPHVLIVPVGASVSFPNFDVVRHHVYSFSKPKRFELKLYGRDQSRTVVFDKPGVVPVGCNIHDQMLGYILVVDTPYAAKTDANGHARIDVPAGAATLRIWSPAIRSADNMTMLPVSIPSGGLVRSVTIGG